MSLKPVQQKTILSTDLNIPIIWIIKDLTLDSFSLSWSRSFARTPFKIKFILLIKSNDPYLNNNIDTIFSTVARSSVIAHIPSTISDSDCLKIGESFVPRDSPFYMVVRDTVVVDLETMSGITTFWFRDTINDGMVFTEKDIDTDEVLFDPHYNIFTQASFLVCRPYITRKTETILNLAFASNATVKTNKKTNQPLMLVAESRIN